MAEPGVFLIHGLGGTQYDLGSMHKRLKNAGFVTHSLTLPGHGTDAEGSRGVTAEDWIEAVTAKYREVRDAASAGCTSWACAWARCSPPCSRSARSTRRATSSCWRRRSIIDGWATPWYRGLRPLLYVVPGVAAR